MTEIRRGLLVATGLGAIGLAAFASPPVPARQVPTAVANGNDAADQASRCRALMSLPIPKGSVTNAVLVSDPASFPVGLGSTSQSSNARISVAKPFCRVEAVVVPAADADIRIEIWLPLDEHWNGRFFGTGNGGAAGRIVYSALAGGLARGYAVASTDVGTHSVDGPDALRFGIGKPELMQNYAHRGVHAMTVVGKLATAAFYGKDPVKSIFSGCSAGGYEAIGEAIRHPDDYDAIIAGDPAINLANFAFFQGYSYTVTHRTPQSAIPASMLPLLGKEVIDQCDAVDGLRDGLIDDPRRCKVDFSKLECGAGKTASCFNADQIGALRAIYRGLHDPRTGRQLYPGFAPGAELASGALVRIAHLNTGSLVNSDSPGPFVWALGADWKAARWMTFDFGAQADRLRAWFAPYENNDPDLRAFKARGGKFILYTGWADPNISPIDHAAFFRAVQAKTGGSANFARFFAVPGMYHCAGGPGPNMFGQAGRPGTSPDDDIVLAVDKWVSGGPAPERLVATKYRDDRPDGPVERTRPLCAYPKVARWSGRGSIDQAANFSCVVPKGRSN